MKYSNAKRLVQQAQQRYTSPGSYPLYAFMKDGEVMCCECVSDECERILSESVDKHGDHAWQIFAVDINWEDPELYCANCSERIESAYAEPEKPEMHGHNVGR